MSEITSNSELTTTEIVEQAISDYHESILPYLNGMVPTIANKFDKANLYSTDEKIIGQWIDGKPLYQKTYFVDIPTTRGNYNIIDVSGLSIDYVVKQDYYAIDKTNHTAEKLGLISNAEFNTFYLYNVSYNKPNDSIRVNESNSYFADGNHKLIATLQYTKTTDEAIAIGSDTDYSLEEKIVGTDIDGKPIYQKTINVSFTPITETLDKYAYYTDLNVGISNIANIIKCEGRNTTNGMAMNYFAMPSSTANCIHLKSINVLWAVDKLTLWYTKTTD